MCKRRGWLALGATALISGCFLGGGSLSSTDDAGVILDDAGVPVLPFQADPPAVYVAKVKNLLTGLPPTQVEIDTVTNAADRKAALASLISNWIKTDEYAGKMLSFFELAFQQTQIASRDFLPLIPNTSSLYVMGKTPPMVNLILNVRESFARTMIELVREGRPFTDAFTTTRFMMTPPLMELYAFLDQNQPDDLEKVTDFFAQTHTQNIVLEDTTNIALSDTLNPSSANYMKWYVPGLAGGKCGLHTRTYPPNAMTLHYLMYGVVSAYGSCQSFETLGANAFFQDADFATWKMVDIRPPNGSEATTPHWDPNALKTGTELVLRTPRIGFYSTPAFHANWQTNVGNQMRVTMNQALIVALGLQVDGTDPTQTDANAPGLDPNHASTPDCKGCHQTLDPTRAVFQATYSYGYGKQSDATLASGKSRFVFQNVVKDMSTVADFANILAQHPAVASGWTQKLCAYADSQACDPADLAPIAAHFANGFQWNALVTELFSSDVVTNAAPTKTSAQKGELASVTRRNHLCAMFDLRYGLTDSCGLNVVYQVSKPTGIPIIAAALPTDGYARGAIDAVMSTQPSLFYRTGMENVCEGLASLVVDPKTAVAKKTYASASPDAAIADMIANLMAIEPGDARSPQLVTLLRACFDDAKAAGATPTDALRSTFTAACLSPSVVGIGL